MKQIPCGIDDFERIIYEDYYYVDKTRYISTIEDQNSYLLFVRPRRMGKSLFVNMLMSYYDIAKAGIFDSLFGNLWIGGHPTKWRNKFIVLKFDFSHVKYESEKLEANFTNYCHNRLENLFVRYSNLFNAQERATVLKQTNIKDAIVNLIECCRNKGYKTYLFIDEYDNFSNVVMSAHGVKAHAEITHGEGFYRDFFKACKGTFDRIFMTGVAPVTYDDLTSGFNIADVVALKPQFDKVIGVTESELREMIDYYRGIGIISSPSDSIVAEMKPWYDNFYFCEDCYGVEPSIYNTDMVMRYIKELVTTGKPPKDMIDTNARTDYKKLNYLVLTEDLENRSLRMSIIKDICATGFTTGHVNEQFSASRCGDEANFKSMLYYFGTLTFGGWDKRGLPKLVVPNKNMGELYLQYMLKLVEHQGYMLNSDYRTLVDRIYYAAADADWQPMVEQVSECYNRYSSIRNAIRGEADVQGFIRGLLCLNDYYEVWPELELGGGYCDVLLLPKGTPRCPTKYSYLIEIKYMKADETDVEKRVHEACEQMQRYISDKHLSGSELLRGTPLMKLYLIFKGNKLIEYGLSNL